MFRATSLPSMSILLCAVLLLAMAPSPAPTYAVGSPSVVAIDRPAGDSIELRDWSPSTTVTVEVLSGPGGSALMPPMSVPVDASGYALVPVPVAFAAGQVVRASLALVVKEVTLTALTVQADATADVISGAAPAAAAVNVEVCNPLCTPAPVTTADAAGRFIVSVGSLPPPASNIRLGTIFAAAIADADGDGQRVEGAVSPTVSAILGGPSGTIVLNGWGGFPASMVTIELFTGPGGALLWTFSGPPDSNGFLEVGGAPLAAGQLLRASDGTTTKELTIVPLSVQGNTVLDVLSGNAPSGGLVTVQAHCGPASTSCVLTRLLAANGAGIFATSLAPIVDIRGGSDLSASVSDADGDRQYVKVGPAAIDTDRDGIGDLIDVQPAIPSAAFDEAPTGLTTGQVLSDGGLMVTVVDAVPPDGVTAAAAGGGPGAVAQVEVCAPPLGVWTVDLTAGDHVVLTCASLTAQVLSGPVTIHTSGSPAVVSVPTGTTAKLSVLPTGELQVQNLAGSAPIGVTVGSVTTDVPAGGTYLVPALPTSADQCKGGGWKSFGVFKNQGDCVSFVATKGKNGPAQ